MFIFAELFAKYLEDLPSREALWRELDPAKLPINLDHVSVPSHFFKLHS